MCVCVSSVCARNTTAHVVYLAAVPLMLPTLPDSPLNHIMSYRCPHALLQRHALQSEPIVAPSVAGCLTSWKKQFKSLFVQFLQHRQVEFNSHESDWQNYKKRNDSWDLSYVDRHWNNQHETTTDVAEHNGPQSVKYMPICIGWSDVALISGHDTVAML